MYPTMWGQNAIICVEKKYIDNNYIRTLPCIKCTRLRISFGRANCIRVRVSLTENTENSIFNFLCGLCTGRVFYMHCMHDLYHLYRIETVFYDDKLYETQKNTKIHDSNKTKKKTEFTI